MAAVFLVAVQALLRSPAAAMVAWPTQNGRTFPAMRQPDAPRKSKALRNNPIKPSLEKDKHLYFDRVDLIVQGGHGGDGAVVRPDGAGVNAQAAERSELVMPPGGTGGGVLLYVDPALTDLLHLRARPKLTAERGRDSPGLLTQRELTRLLLERKGDTDAGDALSQGSPLDLSGATLRVSVPPGTFVKTAGGRALGDLVTPGQELLVASGGEGGPCIVGAARGRVAKRKAADASRGKNGEAEEVDAFELSETEEVDVVQGRPAAPPQRLTLLLRTVADVGFVGFPNAGKSTLLNALTRARATINSYPFTTLMPNLGAMVPASSGDGSETGSGRAAPVLADLPGLVEGAHAGKGLGRAFLQQLRRVRLVLYVLDTQNPEVDVGEQYVILRRELQLYNPRYLDRPHIVALNKLDVFLVNSATEASQSAEASQGPGARQGSGASQGSGTSQGVGARGGVGVRQGTEPDALAAETRRLTRRLAEAARHAAAASAALDGAAGVEAASQLAPPLAVLPISGMRGKGLKALQEAVSAALAELPETEAVAS